MKLLTQIFSSVPKLLSTQSIKRRAHSCSRDVKLAYQSLEERKLLAAGDLELISSALNGDAGNGVSAYPGISSDGQYIVFTSAATNLTDLEDTAVVDVFRYNRVTGETEMVSVDYEGKSPVLSSRDASISGDGRFVAFQSEAGILENLSGPNDSQVYLRDMVTGNTILVSKSISDSYSNGSTRRLFLSENGRYIAFESGASDLVPNDTNNSNDVFVWDSLTLEIVMVSTDENGQQGDERATLHGFSADGSRVAFATSADFLASNNGIEQLFVKEVDTGNITRVTNDYLTGGPADGFLLNHDSDNYPLSGNGNLVAFTSIATNLVPNDTNNQADVFLTDLELGTTVRILGLDGAELNGSSHPDFISNDGRYISFNSVADNLVEDDNNGKYDVFIFDRETGTTRRVSTNSEGVEGDDISVVGLMSGDGNFVVFHSASANFSLNDTNDNFDIFLKDIRLPNLIQSRSVGYHNSEFDESEQIVDDKRPLLPGETATFANYSSYDKGINNLLVDLNADQPANITSNDFQFRFGNSNDVGSWPAITPALQVSVTEGGGVNGTDRISLIFNDFEIVNGWLQVTVLANENTGLDVDDVFYFGNAIGETGDNPDNARVNLIDVALTRENQTGFSTTDINNKYDFNKDTRVNLADVAIARTNQSGFTPLVLLDLSGGRDARGVNGKPTLTPAVSPRGKKSFSIATEFENDKEKRLAQSAQLFSGNYSSLEGSSSGLMLDSIADAYFEDIRRFSDSDSGTVVERNLQISLLNRGSNFDEAFETLS